MSDQQKRCKEFYVRLTDFHETLHFDESSLHLAVFGKLILVIVFFALPFLILVSLLGGLQSFVHLKSLLYLG